MASVVGATFLKSVCAPQMGQTQPASRLPWDRVLNTIDLGLPTMQNTLPEGRPFVKSHSLFSRLFMLFMLSAALPFASKVYADCQHNPVYHFNYSASLTAANYDRASGTTNFQVYLSYNGLSAKRTVCTGNGGSNTIKVTITVDGYSATWSEVRRVNTREGHKSSNLSFSLPTKTANRVVISSVSSGTNNFANTYSLTGATYSNYKIVGATVQPTIGGLNLATNEGASVSSSLRATNHSDDKSYAFRIQTQPAGGYAQIIGNQLTFTPNPGWYGSTSFTYNVQDSDGLYSEPATISVSVNASPVAINKAIQTNQGIPGSATLSATDVDSPAPSVFEIVAGPNSAHGSAVVNGNQLTFTPKQGWFGSTTLTYRARDNLGAWSKPATVNVVVNAIPVASNSSLTVNEDTSGVVTLVATDADGDPLSYSLVSRPNSAHGVVNLAGNNVTFVPAADWNGTTSFTFRVTDGKAESNIATVTIKVLPVNDAPVSRGAMSIKTIENRNVVVEFKVPAKL